MIVELARGRRRPRDGDLAVALLGLADRAHHARDRVRSRARGTGALQSDQPMALWARTVKVYVVPLVRPVIVHEVVGQRSVRTVAGPELVGVDGGAVGVRGDPA